GKGGMNFTSTSTISESGAGLVNTSGMLTVFSVGGEALNGANTVANFNASNTTSGNVSLTNTTATLGITGIAQSGGGSVTVSHTGAMSITGTVSTTGGGAVNLTSSAAMSESGAGFISTTGSLSAKTLNDAGAPIAFASTANGANSIALRARNAADTA